MNDQQRILHGRVVLHVDLDCFYAQVEQKRLGIPRDVPCAVQQWDGLIAVNYAARAAGVTRNMRTAEALTKCPGLRLVHVETIGGDDGEAAAGHGGGAGARSTQKACLERYRRASAQVLAVAHRCLSGAVVEKASIDEFYIDATAQVDRELQERRCADDSALADGGGDGAQGVDAFAWGSVVIGGPLQVGNEFDRRLSIGAGIACRIRGMVHEQLAFTCSAGIASNKLIAKVASAMHKPNQQTVVVPRAAAALLSDLPLGKIRNFGGKLGTQLQAMGCRTAGEVLALPREQLVAAFGDERAQWIVATLQGNSNEPVKAREQPNSLLSAKSFNATSDASTLRRWLAILAAELASRIAVDEAEHCRRPKNLVLHYRGPAGERSKSSAFPRYSPEGPSAEAVTDAAMALLSKAPDALPCSRCALSVTDWQQLCLGGSKSIAAYFASAAAGGQGSSAGSGDGRGTMPAAPPDQARLAPPQGIAQFFAPQSSMRGAGRSPGSAVPASNETCHSHPDVAAAGGAAVAELEQRASAGQGAAPPGAATQGGVLSTSGRGGGSAGHSFASEPLEDLSSIDVSEQERILRDIQEQARRSAGGTTRKRGTLSSSGKGGSGKKGTDTKQTRLPSLFSKLEQHR